MGRDREHILLLTGRPGVGKTTVIRRVIELLSGWSLRGFYTEEIREDGGRKGFRAVSVDGDETVIARADGSTGPRIGRYTVDVPAIDEIVEEALGGRKDTADVYVVDEIGKMECLSGSFLGAMNDLVNRSEPVVATVARSGRGLIDEVKQRPDSRLVEVTRANRDDLPERIVGWLQAHRPGRPS
jgi:nucleoside-triphosphatase